MTSLVIMNLLFLLSVNTALMITVKELMFPFYFELQ